MGLDAVCKFIYVGSTIIDNLSSDAEIDKRIGNAAPTLARPTARVLTTIIIYNPCVTRTLLYDSDTCATYAGRERSFNTFHLRSIRRILGIYLQGTTKYPTLMFRLALSFSVCILCLDNVYVPAAMVRSCLSYENDPISNDILYGEQTLGRKTTGDIKMSA